MKLHLSKITAEGSAWPLSVRLDHLPRVQEMLSALQAPPQHGQLEGELNVRSRGGPVKVEGWIKARLEVPCDLCLEPALVEVDQSFTLVLVPQSGQPAEEEQELHAADLDVSFFEGDEIDLLELAEEQLLLALPDRMVCREDCRGLCPMCGQNLNQKACGCQPDTAGHPFAQMKDFLKQ